MARSKAEEEESFWQFAIVNGKLAEIFFEGKKISGFCYVKASEYATQREQKWIASDTARLQLSCRKKVFRDKLTGKIIPQISAIDLKRRLQGPFYTSQEL